MYGVCVIIIMYGSVLLYMAGSYRILKLCERDFCFPRVFVWNIRRIEIRWFKKKWRHKEIDDFYTDLNISIGAKNNAYSFFFMPVHIFTQVGRAVLCIFYGPGSESVSRFHNAGVGPLQASWVLKFIFLEFLYEKEQ